MQHFPATRLFFLSSFALVKRPIRLMAHAGIMKNYHCHCILDGIHRSLDANLFSGIYELLSKSIAGVRTLGGNLKLG